MERDVAAYNDSRCYRIAGAIDAAEGLKFSGLQPYRAIQHLNDDNERKARSGSYCLVANAFAGLKTLAFRPILGCGTGSYPF